MPSRTLRAQSSGPLRLPFLNSREELEPLLTPDQASTVLQVPKTTLAVWRCTGRVQLAFVKAGRAVRYRREDIEAFLAGGLGHEVSTGERSPKLPVSTEVRR